jgi:hypothetical protein
MKLRFEKYQREHDKGAAASGSAGKVANAMGTTTIHHGYATTLDTLPISNRLLDSAASTHTQHSSLPVIRDRGIAVNQAIRTATGAILTKPHKADVELPLPDGSTFPLSGVLTHPDMRTSLVSVSALLDDPTVKRVEFERAGASVIDASGDIVLKARRNNGVFVIDTADTQSSAGTNVQMAAVSIAELWHRRSSHLSESSLEATARAQVLVEGNQFKKAANAARELCEPCINGKLKRNPFARELRAEIRARRVLERLHMDLSGPYPDGPEGERYRANILDEFSREYITLYLQKKSQFPERFFEWAEPIQNKLNLKIAEVHYDGGGEFENKRIWSWASKNGTKTTFGPARTPQHNGKAERFTGVLDPLIRASMHAAGAPEYLWIYASKHATSAHNRFLLCSRDASRTPHQIFFNLDGIISVNEFRVWGCRAYARRPPRRGDTKLTTKAVLCSNLGYDYDRSSYSLIDDNGHIFQSRDAVFNEESFAGMRKLTSSDEESDDHDEPLVSQPVAIPKPKDDIDKVKLPVAKSNGVNQLEVSPSESSPLVVKVVHSDSEPETQSDDDVDPPLEPDQHLIERILARGTVNGVDCLKIKWRDYPMAEASWEPVTWMQEQIPDILDDFENDRSSSESSSESEDECQLEQKSKEPESSSAPVALLAQPPPRTNPRPQRTIRPIQRYGTQDVHIAEAHATVIDIHPESAKLGDPSSWEEILSRPDRDQWIAAHELEHSAHIKNGTYRIVSKSDIPVGIRLLTWKDIYKLKFGSNALPLKYKARFTIRGCAQSPDQYGDVSAAVFTHRSLRVVCALVAHYDWEFKQLDAISAYLQGNLKEQLYAVAPKGLGIPSDKAVQLLKPIYGLRQAGHEWQEKLFAELRKLNYEQLRWVDKCIFIRRLPKPGDRCLVILVYVDDIPYAFDRRDTVEMTHDINALMKAFELTDLGDAEFIVGWRITRDRSRRTLSLDQQASIQQLLEEYGMDHCNSASTPGTSPDILFGKVKSSSSTAKHSAPVLLNDSQLEHPQLQLKDFRSVIGALQYLTCCTLPVINDAVNKLAQFSNDPQPYHLQALKRILRYLSGHRSDKLTYTGSRQLGVPIAIAYADADYAEDYNTRKSTTGDLIMLCNAAVMWCSKKQKTVARSTMEAEYVAAAAMVNEIICVRRLLASLGSEQIDPTVLHLDNQSTIAIAKEGGKEERRKHIDIKHHIIVEAIDNKVIVVNWIPSKDNLADIFTKALPERRFQALKEIVMGHSSISAGPSSSH